MKKWIAIVLAAVVMLSVVGCKKPKNAETVQEDDLVTVYLAEKKESANAKYEYKYDEQNNLTRVNIYTDGSQYWTVEIENDGNGNPVKYTNYYLGEKQSSTIYEYDEKGNLTKYVEYMGDGSERETMTYTYDQKGNCVREVCYRQGEEQYFDEFTYDEKGNVVTQITDIYGICQKYVYTYGEKNELLLKVEYDEYGNEEYRATYTYDSKGNKTGYQSGTNRSEYVYNDAGMLTKETDWEKEKEITRIEYTYDDSNRLTGKVCYEQSSKASDLTQEYKDGYLYKTVERTFGGGQERNRDETTYREDGEPVLCLKYYNGTLKTRIDYEYAENGSLEKTIVNEKGQISETTCQYRKLRMTREEAEEMEKKLGRIHQYTAILIKE